ncbi:bifunctional 4-hydroxy-2-oxoglutarate aldolase/2-dehydro-3-deoxy-phosphogluconate aldolase [Formicincola oecophyllae]|uniref:2-dehydro-3-deoxy-phosphogluconate aldolase n=2 Tax=Formicincola oecophyllae TaxID=2558361 RepID=A0A4Y6UDG5_9PROT|nr:bifunctional 4-hydroxy-2-oxoglutarate aldolase/2-dehydro-3-deoxy-phosphogluconate aldolase [Formicincola oecophyllae]
MVKRIDQVLDACPVMPVLVINDVKQARPIAEALVSNGVTTLEVTLRTPCAIEVIQEMAKVPGALVGAGTVLHGQHVRQAKAAGAQFVVSPGITTELVRSALAADMPILPGTATISDIMMGMDMGLNRFKFFPAVLNGGIPKLKAFSGVLGHTGLRFCPTGGIDGSTWKDWLQLPTVACVGGSWLTSGNATPEEVAKRAAALGLKKK